jgi:hypothetical protein
VTTLKSRPSLYVTLAIIIVSTVTISMSLHSALHYVETQNKIIREMKKTSTLTLSSLQKNVTTLIESYSISEYDNLVLNEMEPPEIYAIVIEDFKTGRFWGENRTSAEKSETVPERLPILIPKTLSISQGFGGVITLSGTTYAHYRVKNSAVSASTSPIIRCAKS